MIPVFVLAMSVVLSDLPMQETERRFEREFTGASAEGVVQVEGDLDENNTRTYGTPYRADRSLWKLNRTLTIENAGPVAVRNPRLLVNGRGPAYTLDDLLEQAVPEPYEGMDKALAIYRFFIENTLHSTLRDFFSNDPIRLYTVMGFALCNESGNALARFLNHAGFETVHGAPFNHSTTEVRHGERSVLLDANMRGFFLGRDNRTLLSESDLAADPDLVFRNAIAWPRSHLHRHRPGLHLKYQALQISPQPRARPKTMAQGGRLPHFFLRPGESMTYDYADTKKAYRFDAIRGASGIESLFASARLRYRTRIDDSFLEQPGVRVENTFLEVRITVPTLATGGSIVLEHADPLPPTTLSFDARTTRTVRWTPVAPGVSALDLDTLLDATSAAGERCRHIGLRLETAGRPPSEIAQVYEHDVEFQFQRKALPHLRLGENRVRYIDDNPEDAASRRIRYVHVWREATLADPPSPLVPVGPTGEIRSLQPTLAWQFATPEERETASEIHVAVSEHEDFRWGVSHALEPIYPVEPDEDFATSWHPHRPGLLSSGGEYHWRVRYRNAAGVWAPWSEARTFVPLGPMPPVALRVEFDSEEPVLHWKASPEGTRPVLYEIHGSEQFGFTPSTDPTPFALGDTAPPTAKAWHYYEDYPTTRPTTVIAATEATRFRPFRAPADPMPVYCRVVAVDAHGTRSEASGQIALPSPWLVAPERIAATPGTPVAFRVRSNRSLGRYYARDSNLSWYHCNFWDKQTVNYSLRLSGAEGGGAPVPWMTVSPEGRVEGRLPDAIGLPVEIEVTATAHPSGKHHARRIVLEPTEKRDPDDETP